MNLVEKYLKGHDPDAEEKLKANQEKQGIEAYMMCATVFELLIFIVYVLRFNSGTFHPALKTVAFAFVTTAYVVSMLICRDNRKSYIKILQK